MNRLIVFPVTILLMLSILNIVIGANNSLRDDTYWSEETGNLSEGFNVTVDGILYWHANSTDDIYAFHDNGDGTWTLYDRHTYEEVAIMRSDGSVGPTFGSEDIWAIDGLLVFVLAIIAGTALLGIQFLGSGVSTFSQYLAFNSLFFFGLWGILSFATMSYFSFTIGVLPMGGLIYFTLTAMFVIGFVNTVGESGS